MKVATTYFEITTMQLPPLLRDNVRDNKAVLILGAGASKEARNTAGQSPPNGQQLAELISDHFLGGQFRDAPLGQVAEYAISESDIVTVQLFIRDILSALNSTVSSAHAALTHIRWPGMATTNYDLLVESAYSQSSAALQQPIPFIDNADRVLTGSPSDSFVYLKLHGCVTRSTVTEPPFIITPDQYAQFTLGRSHVFQHLLNWAREYTLVFVGQRIDDINFRHLLLLLDDELPSRPRYFMITPGPSDIVVRYWEKKRIGVLSGTFNEFLTSL